MILSSLSVSVLYMIYIFTNDTKVNCSVLLYFQNESNWNFSIKGKYKDPITCSENATDGGTVDLPYSAAVTSSVLTRLENRLENNWVIKSILKKVF